MPKHLKIDGSNHTMHGKQFLLSIIQWFASSRFSLCGCRTHSDIAATCNSCLRFRKQRSCNALCHAPVATRIGCWPKEAAESEPINQRYKRLDMFFFSLPYLYNASLTLCFVPLQDFAIGFSNFSSCLGFLNLLCQWSQ